VEGRVVAYLKVYGTVLCGGNDKIAKKNSVLVRSLALPA
jgi:hypothetical protein